MSRNHRSRAPRLAMATSTLLVLTRAGAGPAALLAQHVELQLLGGRMSDESGVVGRGLTVVPAIGFTGGRGSLRLDGRVTALEGGGHLLGAGAAFHVVMGQVGSVELGTGGSVGVLTAGSGFRSLTAELAPGVRLHGRAASVGAGVGVRAASLASSPPAWREALPLGDAGLDERALARGLWAEGRAALGALTLGVHGRTSRSGQSSWREGQLGASVDVGPLVLSGFAGARAGDGPGSWAGGSASVRVSPGVALTAQLTRHPNDPLTGQPGGRTAAVGVTLSRGAHTRPSNGSPTRPVRLALRAQPDVRVELLADWNDWRAEPVAHRGGGVYDVELHLPPGTYHFVFRVDGELHVPEGFETAPDDFGGRSAVVRVRG